MHTESEVGNIIRANRDSKGFTQSELATITDVTLRTIQNIESGSNYPTYGVLYKMIRSLEFSADTIFWPERVAYTPKQEQLMRVLATCNEQELEMIIDVVFACLRSIKLNKGIKKADDF